MSIFNIINIACFLSWIFLFILPSCYLFIRWSDKYNILEDSFNEKSLMTYYKLFKAGNTPKSDGKYKDLFHNDYHKLYGRKNFIIPLLLLACVTATGIYALSRTLLFINNPDLGSQILPPIALSAFSGAYMFIGFDQVKRIRTQDFTYHDLYRWGFRLIICIPIGYALTAGKETIGIPLAFCLGVLPLKGIIKYSKRCLSKMTQMHVDDDVQSSELQNLQGIEKEEAERLQEEGITNILQLAYCNPIDLTMRTTLDFLYITDIKSQALLWIYLGAKLDDHLRLLGLRGAHEAYILKDMIDSGDPAKIEVANKNIDEISNYLKVSPLSFKKTLHEVTDDPHTLFLYNLWCNEEYDICIDSPIGN